MLTIFYFTSKYFLIVKLKVRRGKSKNDPLTKLEDPNSRICLNFYVNCLCLCLYDNGYWHVKWNRQDEFKFQLKFCIHINNFRKGVNPSRLLSTWCKIVKQTHLLDLRIDWLILMSSQLDWGYFMPSC